MPAKTRKTSEKHNLSGVTIDPEEVAKFSALAAEWWDMQGKFKPLHKLNPTRLAYIKKHICDHFKRDPNVEKPFEGLRVLDIGCGGGLLSEPMARLGANVVGADAGEANIKTASVHAMEAGLEIDYRNTTADDLAAKGEKFDVILNMEVVEHVADVTAFMQSCCAMMKPKGCQFFATLNRTPKSFAFAIVGAEYILSWLPRGTHDWHKFITPAEMEDQLAMGGCEVKFMTGVSYAPLSDKWQLSNDLAVNYMGVGVK